MQTEASINHWKLCRAEDVPLDAARMFSVAGMKMALFHRAEGWFALDDHCPHRSAPLHEGVVEDGAVICPWHQWQFQLADGKCRNLPQASVPTFPVTMREGEIWVEIPVPEK